MGPLPRFAPRRPLGRTGFPATALGIGDLADRNVPFADCVATLRRALDAGLNVVDTAPGYEDGYSEEIVGAALAGRDGVFVIDKIDHLDRPVRPQLEASLRRLGRAAVDLVAFHGLTSLGQWQALVAADGGLDQLAACVRDGLVRFRGISCHDPAVLAAAIPSGLLDVVMFPLGPFVHPRYLDEVLPLARAHGVGTVCFKTFGAGKLLGDTTGYNQPLEPRPRGKWSAGPAPQGGSPSLPHLSVAECVRYTLTCDPDVALLGLSFPHEQEAALGAAAAFAPLTPAELAEVRARAEVAIAGKGPCWWNPPPG